MNETWVCGTCKSINRQRDGKCYHCRGRRQDAMVWDTPVPAPRVEAAAVVRTDRAYVPAWPLAVLAGGMILVASALGIVLLVQQALGFGALKAAFLDSIGNQLRDADPELLALSLQSVGLAMLRSLLALLALVSFAGWLALVTRNVPVLGGGSPSRGPLRVFVYTLIPLWNLIKVPGMLQEALYRLDSEEGGFGMVMAAWIGLVGSWILSFVAGWAITASSVSAILGAATLTEARDAFGTMLDRSFLLGVVTEVMVAFGAVILVMLMARIERRCAHRDREIRAAAAS